MPKNVIKSKSNTNEQQPNEKNQFFDNLNSVLTIQEVARILKVSPSSVYQLHYRKVLPSIKVGKHVRFFSMDVQRWLLSKRKEKPEEL